MDRKNNFKRLFTPPFWLIMILTVASAVSLTLVFVKDLEEYWIAYVTYLVSSYTLTVLCIYIFPKIWKAIKKQICKYRFGKRYMTDPAFKVHIHLYISLGINLLYVAFNIFSGIIYRTYWFLLLAGYYFTLALMRFLLVRYINRNKIGSFMIGEWKRTRACAYISTLINLSLSGVILMMMYQDRGFAYHGLLIYVMAAYTFYITIAAIINIVKYRKYNSPIMTTTKSINLAASLVSMLSLETAMFASFGKDSTTEMKRTMIAATGAGICIILTAMSSYMIIHSTIFIRNFRRKTNMSDQNNSFDYNYSAKEQEEIRKIRKKYDEQQNTETDKIQKLRLLDSGVTKKGTVISVIIGVIGTLIMGCGMSLIMSEFSKILGSLEHLSLPIGIALGIVGIILVISAYPIYKNVTGRERKRIAPEIIKISDELMK